MSRPPHDPLLAALDALPGHAAPVRFFIRDDDAGWADERLHALLDCTAQAGVPIDLAAIPQAVQPSLAAALHQRIDAGQQIGLHQHGLAHTNHEPEGRKCEFGAARNAAQRRDDLASGRARLQALFGSRLDDIFTPPWNRCTADTPALLAGLGVTALSRDRGATPQHDLAELPVDVDWCKQVRLADGDIDAAGQQASMALAALVQPGAIIGLMLHHAVMADAELAWLAAALPRWAAHGRAHWQPMRSLLNLSNMPARALPQAPVGVR